MGTSMVQMAHKHISVVSLQRGNKERISCKTDIIGSNTHGRELGCTDVCTHSRLWMLIEIMVLLYLA